MKVDVRHALHPEAVKALDTEQLRRHFLIETVFEPGEIVLTYSHYDRMIVGGAMPSSGALTLTAPEAVGQETFLAERELGVLNVGGAGRLVVDGTTHELGRLDVVYVGRGAKDVQFESIDGGEPARFYLVSAPAHHSYPTVRIGQDKAKHIELGAMETANARTISQFIHPDVCQSCQLTLGVTQLKPGSVWNTMPAHTHDRRMEAYLYFGLDPAQRVFHFMGEPAETRHMVVATEQAIISPPWSIHSGAGTTNYTFCWAMAGDNKSFTDMDHIAVKDLK